MSVLFTILFSVLGMVPGVCRHLVSICDCSVVCGVWGDPLPKSVFSHGEATVCLLLLVELLFL